MTEFSSIKCLKTKLVVVKLLADGKHLNGKHLVVGKLLADVKLFSVGKHLVDAKHLASIQMLTDVTDLPDLTIDEKFE